MIKIIPAIIVTMTYPTVTIYTPARKCVVGMTINIIHREKMENVNWQRADVGRWEK
jgi:hypothetical protein